MHITRPHVQLYTESNKKYIWILLFRFITETILHAGITLHVIVEVYSSISLLSQDYRIEPTATSTKHWCFRSTSNSIPVGGKTRHLPEWESKTAGIRIYLSLGRHVLVWKSRLTSDAQYNMHLRRPFTFWIRTQGPVPSTWEK